MDRLMEDLGFIEGENTQWCNASDFESNPKIKVRKLYIVSYSKEGRPKHLPISAYKLVTINRQDFGIMKGKDIVDCVQFKKSVKNNSFEFYYIETPKDYLRRNNLEKIGITA